ncbi:16S rRNA (guanine(966)-N(2))-methyltransferase RsmD [Sandarakinorhabdus cyanobacteriorum]|uniref:16S rRNA (Guanine(966)-N(2))-methyltransferase RsmD n=1 Tax=Sandarakinorhabdus cyanobacteriorum TaxID=1981098 RepID=A0A255YHV8_9SPHN|nr:16S rRNA (guanine(966)-N(2))-methyltransferase RsmD [Sandarakinorhabdus cyanobacteriorum]OYQ28264.1 16S rRNA (guanine(966)-N(2))-methyltransferase RsmD [Sandarakinorhabdus cyanobacteriorum]
MRIISGRWRGRAIAAPAGQATRPTSDRAREAIFSMLASRLGSFDGLDVLDVFAGTGALGLEALSRGAGSACFIDNDAAAVKAIKANLATLGAIAAVRQSPVTSLGPAPRGHHLVFLDPPYGQGLAGPALAHLAAHGWLAPGAIISIETAAADPLDSPFEQLVERRFGKALVRLLRAP